MRQYSPTNATETALQEKKGSARHIDVLLNSPEKLQKLDDSNNIDFHIKKVLSPLKGEDYKELCEKAEKAGVRVLWAEAGDAFHFNSPSEVSFTILGPDPGRETSPVNVNAQCIVAALRYGKFDCLFTGDVAREGEENLLGILRRTGKEFEVLKVAHHGSKYSTPEELLDIVRPGLCLISAGRYNRYGHPHAELITRLYKAGADVRITRYGGELTVTTDGETYHFCAYDEEEYAEETYVCR